jgi:hypothetical protein
MIASDAGIQSSLFFFMVKSISDGKNTGKSN